MDVNLLYFTLHGNSASEPTAWGAILIEDGEMESFVGVENTEFTALVDGLQKCLERFPTTLPIVIRSRHRTVNQLGKRWIDTWRRDGWENEESPDVIALLLDTLETRRVEWFQPSYAEALDKSVLEYAIDELEYYHQHAPSISTRESTSVESVNSEQEADDEHQPVEAFPQTNTDAIEDNTSHHPQASTPNVASNLDGEIVLTSAIDQEPIETTIEEYQPTDDNTAPSIQLDSTTNSALPSSINEDENQHQESQHKSTIENSVSINQTLQTPPIIEPVDTPLETEDQIQFPYIDDQGWEQFYTLFDAPETPIEQTIPCRILAYVDALQHVDLASWSFALIDKPSQVALLQSMGLRQITEQQALLQGCITLLKKIRNPNHTIEFRTHRQSMSQLLQMLIADPYAECPTEWEDSSALVSQLSFYLEQRQVSVRQISQDKPDFATQIVTHLSLQSLNALNTGERVDFTLRKQKFPLERLVN